MSPCGGECRVGRSRCRADVAVWRRVSCWSLTLPRGCRRVAASVVLVARCRAGPSSPAHAGAGAAPIRGTASIARSPPTNDRHQQTIDVGRRAAAAHCRTERRTGASRSSRTPQVDLACSSLSTGSRRQSERCHVSAVASGLLAKTPYLAALARRRRPHHRIRRRGGRTSPQPEFKKWRRRPAATAPPKRRQRVGLIAGRSADQRRWENL